MSQLERNGAFLNSQVMIGSPYGQASPFTLTETVDLGNGPYYHVAGNTSLKVGSGKIDISHQCSLYGVSQPDDMSILQLAVLELYHFYKLGRSSLTLRGQRPNVVLVLDILLCLLFLIL